MCEHTLILPMMNILLEDYLHDHIIYGLGKYEKIQSCHFSYCLYACLALSNTSIQMRLLSIVGNVVLVELGSSNE